jgi:hypothetical protein
MNTHTLAQIKQRYPTALYSFMRVTHPIESMQKFLDDPIKNPVFAYPRTLSVERAEGYLSQLQAELEHVQDPAVRKFLQHRITEAEILHAFTKHRRGSMTADELRAYRDGMVELYGPVRADYFAGALTHLEHLASERQDETALKVLSTIKYQPAQLPSPSPAAFKHYRVLMQQHLADMFSGLPAGTTAEAAITQALQLTGLVAGGWSVRTVPHGTNVAISRHRKTVNIGQHYHPASSFRLQQIVAHEVYGHARRFESAGDPACGLDEEGVAIVYEQLLAKRFIYKRMLRYIALGLSWGVDGTPRDFVTTYQIMVPLAGLATNKTGRDAQQIAFKETLRAFRGGNPDVPGMILLKDKLYFESNLGVWQYLSEKQLDAAAFSRLMDGYDVIPKEELL